MIGKNDYKEMEVRLNGNWQKADVLKTLADGTCLILMGNKVANGNYMAGACVPADAYREIKTTETRVKSAIAIITALVDAGYEPDSDGDWNHEDYSKETFTGEMFMTCGKKPLKEFLYEPEWLEEVELNNRVEVMDEPNDDDEFMFI